MATTLVADVETNGYLQETTKMWCLGVGDPRTEEVVLYADQPGYPPIKEGLQRLSTADRVVGHNFLGFDLFAIEKLYPGTLRFEQIWDTLVASRLCHPEGVHALENWGDRLGFPKGDHTDFSRWSPEMGAYCAQDVLITIKVFKRLWNQVKVHGDSLAVEFKVAYVLALQEQHGFRIDVAEARELEADLRQEHSDIEAELQDVFKPVWRPVKATWNWKKRAWTDVDVFTPKRDNAKMGYTEGAPLTKVELQPFNPQSRQQVVYRLTSLHGWRPRKFTDAGAPQVDESVLSELRYPEAEPLKRLFRVTKQLGQIADGENAWLKLEQDGYVHGAVNQLGARTHRMSHFKPNMAQVDKKDLRMRAVWKPDVGHKLVGSDAEGLELRMLAHYLAKYDKGAYGEAVVSGDKDQGTDPHSLTRKAVGLYKRDNAKRVIYAYLYGAGDTKLGLIIFDDADEAGKPRPSGSPSSVGKAARSRLEAGIAGLGKVIEGVKCRHKKAPRGEKVYFRSFDGRQIESNSGHSALNTLLQGAGAVVMKHALAIFHFEEAPKVGLVNNLLPVDFAYCANVHDEVQLSVVPERADEVGKLFAECIRLAGERLGVRCPLSGSYDIGDNWKETH